MVSQGFTEIDISCDTIYTYDNNGELKIGDLVVNSFRKSFKKSMILEGSPSNLQENPTDIIINNFGKTVLNMLFYQTSVYRCMLRLVHKQNNEIFYRNIINEDLRDLLMKCLSPDKPKSVSELLQHPFIKNRNDALDCQKLHIGGELIEYIESRRKTHKYHPQEMSSILYQNSIINDDTSRLAFFAIILYFHLK